MFYRANIKSRPVPVEFPTGLLRGNKETFEVTFLHQDGTLHCTQITRDNSVDIQILIDSLVAVLNNNNVKSLKIEATTPVDLNQVSGPDTSNDIDISAG